MARWLGVTCIYRTSCRVQDDGATPLWIASRGGYDAVVSALLASGAAVNQATTVSVGFWQ